ncbi:hypothetical protein D9758_010770 [Tetrapyrgos nigripes]|uniref:Uncharacterized protein n=1 Tax=Tetrapyrgos nigripes TaxID=182062 RepID=A0A8H5FYH5_9AGAR|nr:hypothetical protein D9758_010770 [Tetrapyrgos nigripes]
MNTRKPYRGTQHKLLIAMDVGTTFSGVSHCPLDPGTVPEIKLVTRFPAQEHVGGDAKIPSVLYYGQDGSVKAAGAEATREGILETAEEEGWVLAKWFKLHLRPSKCTNTFPLGTTNDTTSQFLHPLPPTKSAIDVFADFLHYLFSCTKTFIIQSMHDGASIWSSVETTQSIQFVLSLPNGWEGAQQTAMR